MIKSPIFKKTKGFTLIEILVTIAIIAVLVGITIPVFRSFQPTLQLSGTVRALASDLRYTQQMAVTEQINYCLQLFLLEKKYQIVQCGQTQPILEKTLPDEIVSFSANFTNNEVEFNPYGAVKEDGIITLENSKSQTKTIEVKPSGFVKITE